MRNIVCPESMKVNYMKNQCFTASVVCWTESLNLQLQWNCVAMHNLFKSEALSALQLAASSSWLHVRKAVHVQSWSSSVVNRFCAGRGLDCLNMNHFLHGCWLVFAERLVEGWAETTRVLLPSEPGLGQNLENEWCWLHWSIFSSC